MSLPLGFPPGVDPASGTQTELNVPTPAGTSFLQQTVPSGKAWLMQMIGGFGETNGAGATRDWRLNIRNAVPFYEALIPMGAAIVDTESIFWTYALGLPQLAQASGSAWKLTQGLPWVVVTAGGIYELTIDNALVADRLGLGGAGDLNGVNYVYTEYDYGSVSGGGTTVEATGPFLLVPGVTADAA